MPEFTHAPTIRTPKLPTQETRRDLWSDVEEHSDLHVEQGGSGSSLPFSAETVPVEQEVRHTNDEIYTPELRDDNVQVDLDKEDLALEHTRLLAERDVVDHEGERIR